MAGSSSTMSMLAINVGSLLRILLQRAYVYLPIAVLANDNREAIWRRITMSR
jgi:hypothetical protein